MSGEGHDDKPTAQQIADACTPEQRADILQMTDLHPIRITTEADAERFPPHVLLMKPPSDNLKAGTPLRQFRLSPLGLDVRDILAGSAK